MKKYYFLIIVALILGLVFTGCSLLSNISQVPTTEQIGVTYLTKNGPLSLMIAVGMTTMESLPKQPTLVVPMPCSAML